MKKTPIAIALLGAVILTTPAVIGHFAERDIRDGVANLVSMSSASGYSVVFKDYDKGLFSSEARLVVSAPVPSDLMKEFEADRFDVPVRATISHGPLTLVHENDELDLRPALAAIEMGVDFERLRQLPGAGRGVESAAFRMLLEAVDGIAPGIGAASTYVDTRFFGRPGRNRERASTGPLGILDPTLLLTSELNGRTTIEGSMAAVSVTDLNGVAVQWDGASVAGTYVGSDQENTIELVFAPLTMSAGADRNLKVGPSSISSRWTGEYFSHDPDSIFVQASMGGLSVQEGEEGLKIGDVEIGASLRADAGAVDVDYKFALEGIEFVSLSAADMPRISANVELSLAGMERAAWVELLRAISPARVDFDADPVAEFRALRVGWQNVLEASAPGAVRIELEKARIDIDGAPIEGNLALRFLEPVGQRSPLGYIEATAFLEAPEALVMRLLVRLQTHQLETLRNRGRIQSSDEQLSTAARVGAQNGIELAIASGYLVRGDSGVLSLHSEVAGGEVELNGVPFPLAGSFLPR